MLEVADGDGEEGARSRWLCLGSVFGPWCTWLKPFLVVHFPPRSTLQQTKLPHLRVTAAYDPHSETGHWCGETGHVTPPHHTP